MPRIQLIKWFLLLLILFSIPLLCLSLPIAIQSHAVNPYSNIISDLRNNWQSPITYLKKRGYIPILNDRFDEKRSSRSSEDKLQKSSAKFEDKSYAYDKALQVREDLLDSLYGHAENIRDVPVKPKVSKDDKDGFLRNLKDKFLGFFGGKKSDINQEKTRFTFNFKSDAEPELKLLPSISSGDSAGNSGIGSSSGERKVLTNSVKSSSKTFANNQHDLYDMGNQKLVLMARYM